MDIDKTQSRKKFLFAGISTAALFTAVRFLVPAKKKQIVPQTSVKMLTQDGKLVEVDASKFYPGTFRKINEEQLKNFVNKKQSKI
jgi:hypothetical protein